ncbi:unnamed protein product [Leptosia nina]|uniref:Uncharacterized protein n=1 Tax=Leptosia nina TaxID=320188 RepID=A0AAV1J2F7_9NEOP
MRRVSPRYPVDRYLVESSKTMDTVKIIDDDLWNPEPALRPEDECMLRKLHEMLQSTADDLKVLSGELSKYHETGVQVKSLPTPLDEEFNEKLHIEEIVNAKFFGQKIVDPSNTTSLKSTDLVQELIASKIRENKNVVKPITNSKKPSKILKISGTKIVHIPEYTLDTKSNFISNNVYNRETAVQYSEIVHNPTYSHVDQVYSSKSLQIQEMPKINIRGELKVQNVLLLDIIHDNNDIVDSSEIKNNVCVIALNHELSKMTQEDKHKVDVSFPPSTTRKVFKMSTHESSDSSQNLTYQRQMIRNPKVVKNNTEIKIPCAGTIRKDTRKAHQSLNEWKKKLSSVYGHSSKNNKSVREKKKVDTKSATSERPTSKICNKNGNVLNNTEYIPYTKLTLGGVKVKDIEKELPHVSSKKDYSLSPILDKILSRQNSFSNDKSQTKEKKGDSKILTISDENLLQEVLDIEEKVSITLSSKTVNKESNLKNHKELVDFSTTEKNTSNNSPNDENTYADDFEADNSEELSEFMVSASQSKPQIAVQRDSNKNNKKFAQESNTFIKQSNLAFKTQIDTFEFIHTVDTQESATQSNIASKICLKETQTSPRIENDILNIHNDLGIDPKREVERMFNLEKDFIKKLIVDEYSDLIDNLNKPSISKNSKVSVDSRNTSLIPKNTQTSPARVKNVTTSPIATKTRTTSPFTLSLAVHRQTSPFVPSEGNNLGSRAASENSDDLDNDGFDITINLSSPRFNLRLPKSSSDIANCQRTLVNKKVRSQVSSSSSVEDYTSSDISFGEIKRQFRRRLRRHKIPSISEPSSSGSKSSNNLSNAPMRSEGEISVHRSMSNKYSKSEGEISLGQLK